MLQNLSYYKPLFLLSILLFFTNCSKERSHDIQFYYWRSASAVDQAEKELFNRLQSQKLYLRLFDVDKKHAGPEPQGIISSFDASALTAEYVPVVFITNRTFRNTSPDQIEELATNVSNLVETIVQENKIGPYKELQIDCDWTANTKDNFFTFLKVLKQKTGKDITCTLRLHQIKDRNRTGVPPVDKGYIMCYATSNPLDSGSKNSILDMDLLQNYLQAVNDYPVAFDVALPLYSWAIVTNHMGKAKLINGVVETELQTDAFKKTDDNMYEVQEDLFFRGIYLNKGFRLKVERITPELLRDARHYLNQKINRPYDIVYYHLDSTFIKRFSISDLTHTSGV